MSTIMFRSRAATALVAFMLLVTLAPTAHAEEEDVPTNPWGLIAIPLLGLAGDAGQTLLLWEAPTDDGGSPILGYRVYKVTANGSEPNRTLIGETEETLFFDATPPSPEEGPLIEYQVTAYNAVGESGPSGNAYATRGPSCFTVVTSTPPNVIVDPGCLGPGTLPHIRRVCLQELDICTPGV